jgi:hypothetical protein
MTERRRLPNKRASQNFSFERADLKYSCTVKRFDGGGSADVGCGTQQVISSIARRTPADKQPTPVTSPRRLLPVRVKLWRVDAKVGKVRPPNGDAAQCSREPSSGTARSTLTSPATKAFICFPRAPIQ